MTERRKPCASETRGRWIRRSTLIAAIGFCAARGIGAEPTTAGRDIAWFLQRLRTVEHLPELEDSHTSLSSTWDRTGGNADGTDFKRIEGTTNILLDVDGPGCVHRIFTGGSEPDHAGMPAYLRVDGTHLQIFLDQQEKPVFDFPVVEFFNPTKGPFPAPLAGDKSSGWTYPGCLFPIPYSRHCRVQLVNPAATNWGCYWQVAYTTYAPDVQVITLDWPLNEYARAELEAVRGTWQSIQTGLPPPPEWTSEKKSKLDPGDTLVLKHSGAGVVSELRISIDPATPELFRSLRLVMSWNDSARPAVEMSVGDFFGNGYSGYAPESRYSSMVMGISADEICCRFPMPFARGARIELRNNSPTTQVHARMAWKVEKRDVLPPSWGFFHATHGEEPAATGGSIKLGPKDVPGHLVLDHIGRGKYVGVILREDWPHESWWGEGDWMIWTDEHGWPPSYHGTGTEEYFNSGWCRFDRKAISGYIALHPGHPAEYSFHLNDAFQFHNFIRVAVETEGWDTADELIRQEHPVWASTAFWYGAEL